MSPPSTASNPVPRSEEYRWFVDEVQPCEPSLKAYLHGSFPAIRDVEDIVQESFLRIWKARTTQPILSAKAFLFTVARHLAVDRMRRAQCSPIDYVGHLGGLSVLDDRPHVAEVVSRRERVWLLADAIADLPTRCREVFILHKIKGYSRREVAAQLRLSEKTVEVQTARAMRRCGNYLRRRCADGIF